jgi:hypothetical protein
MTKEKENQNYFADCYVLTDNRTKEFVNAFLNKFLPDREEMADEYEVPQYSSNSTEIYNTADNLIELLERHKNEIHTVYWRNNTRTTVQNAMCFFTNDGHVIVGLSCHTKYPDTSIENYYLKELKSFCKSESGYIAYEEPATHNTTEFLERVKNSEAIK